MDLSAKATMGKFSRNAHHDADAKTILQQDNKNGCSYRHLKAYKNIHS